MVVLHFKKGAANEFLYETTTDTKIEDLVELLCEMNNLRLKVDRAAMAIEDLAAKGPLKPEGLRGLDEAGYADYLKGEDITVTDGLKMMPPQVGQRFVKDEQHYRTGWCLDEAMSQKMLDYSTEMKKLIHKSSVEQKRILKKEVLLE